MRKMSLISLLIAFVICLGVVPPHAFAEKQEKETAKSSILIERDTGKVLAGENMEEELPPASMTKIMTMLLIMEEIEAGTLKYDEKVRVSEYAASMGGSQIFLEPGEEMTVKDLLKGIAVASGNDASVALAEKIAGTEDAFVKKMNEKARELGLSHTKFQNATGLPAADHYSTAKDMALMARALLGHEEITEFTSIYEDYLRKDSDDPFWLVNTNKLVKFYPGVDGLKTGFTKEARYCLTATAKKDGMRVVAVVMGAETPKQRNIEVSRLLDYGFNQYTIKQLYKQDQTVAKLDMLKARNKDVPIVTAEPVSLLVKKGEKLGELSSKIIYQSELSLPLKAGEQVGVLEVKADGKLISSTPVIMKEDLPKASYWLLIKRSFDDMVKFH
ncbi:D-alanyl-D-alanine carboxypeptidase (penicillin-binding protein 5/6) [Terribacillus halophilus]|uniref:serine-type D-Ala-D-Ala carboxypeptidase n=1 Tax=Terribacillus halophilus TaxID=361279 RepID=A0A1G6UWC0_9BACI|nr:D-alanyl-D-alanine carboxypeptidase family protein [Terribacillus halophilus]SDD45563.1 D-alanyl-D-alanine carboxypeptidase (penicillin-binding protein 5/6) [Terribacillus halophilus]